MASLALVAGQSIVAQAQEHPNIVVFLVDDMGLRDTSLPFLCDETGNEVRYPLNDWYHTPNMERIFLLRQSLTRIDGIAIRVIHRTLPMVYPHTEDVHLVRQIPLPFV